MSRSGDKHSYGPDDARVLRALFLEEVGNYLDRILQAAEGFVHSTSHPDFVPGEELDALFRALHTLKGAAGSVGHGAIAQATHDLEDLCADIRHGRLTPTPGIIERMEDELGALRALVEGARSRPSSGVPPVAATAPSLLVDRRKENERRLVGDRRGQDGAVQVESSHLDRMLEHVGDLVVLRTRMERALGRLQGVRSQLTELKSEFDRLPEAAALSKRLAEATLELNDNLRDTLSETESLRVTTEGLNNTVRHARLMRVDWIFHRLRAVLHEAEKATGKKAQLITGGGNLELDRTLLEKLFPPLLHLVRNAMAHGVEFPEMRRQAGKPETGRIEILARLDGDFVFLTFSDDGAGVDRERARRTLIDQGRLAADETLDDERLVAALFEVGFSTRETADTMAGRGMGLDIVRTTVHSLGGEVNCETARGRGTRFDMSFPLTTAITEALLFKVGGQVYALPQSHVLGTSPGSPEAAAASTEAALDLRILFGTTASIDSATIAARWGNRTFSIVCDRVIGPRTIVIRPSGAIIGRIPYFAGTTVSGSGKAQLVLNTRALFELTRLAKKAGTAQTSATL